MKSQRPNSVAAWDYDEVARSVSADLVDILGPEPEEPVAVPPLAFPPSRDRTAPSRPRGDLAGRIGVILAAGLVGVAGGLALSHVATPEVGAWPSFLERNG
jgi:hypothetical protein